MLVRMVTVEKAEVHWVWGAEVRERKLLCTWGLRVPPHFPREGTRKCRCVGGDGVINGMVEFEVNFNV